MDAKDIRKGDTVEVRYTGEVYWKNGDYACIRSGDRDLPAVPYDLVHKIVTPEAEATEAQSVEDRLAALEKTIGLLDETIDLLKLRLENADRISESQTRMLRELHRRLFDIEEFSGPRHYSVSARGRGV